MDIENLQKKTLEGIEDCKKKIKEYEGLINYWKGYKESLESLSLHLRMEKIKDIVHKDIKE